MCVHSSSANSCRKDNEQLKRYLEQYGVDMSGYRRSQVLHFVKRDIFQNTPGPLPRLKGDFDNLIQDRLIIKHQ